MVPSSRKHGGLAGTEDDLRALAGIVPPEAVTPTEREPGTVTGVVDVGADVERTQRERDGRG